MLTNYNAPALTSAAMVVAVTGAIFWAATSGRVKQVAAA